MTLKDVFIINLKKFRRQKNLSQMKLAEKCNTATSYIGEIEIGRKFPSITMIENLARVLDIEAYRLFVDESEASTGSEKAAACIAKLPLESRRLLTAYIKNAVIDGISRVFNLEEAIQLPDIPRPSKKKNSRRQGSTD